MTYAEAFLYDRRTLVVRTRAAAQAHDVYLARDVQSGATATGPSARDAVRRLRVRAA